MDTEKNEKEEVELKTGFLKKAWQSITKIEKYPDMAAEGVGKAFGYMTKIVLILAIVLSLGMIYQTYQAITEGVQYLENDVPEFSYEEGILNVESEGAIIIENSEAGKIIIDTKTEAEQTINEYTELTREAGNGIIILKDKIILKDGTTTGSINYQYKEMLKQMGITKFTKQDLINYLTTSQSINLYVSMFITFVVYMFILYLLTTISNAVMLSFIGYITTWLAKIRMRYVAVFNMAVYALTLSIILEMIYIGINMFVPFNIKYFQVMYITVAAIYLIAAIFILKTEFMKKQMELMKIAEAQILIKQELDKQKEEEQNKEQEKKQDKKEKKDSEEKGEDLGQEPEGSNA